jgi:hypothetical protein
LAVSIASARFRLGQIAGELGEAEELTGIVAKRSDRDIGPKRRAVFAKTPTGIDKFPLLRGHS